MAEINSEQISEVMRMLGSKKSEIKISKALANLETARAVPMTEERRQKQSEAQRERRRREREALGETAATTEPRKRGRPAKPVDPDAPKRGRGRPKKQDAQTTPPEG